MTSARQVWETSRTVLSDQDGIVAVIRSFMDESGIHDGSPVVTVGTYFGRPSQWKAFTKEWNHRKRPINVFHAADCANLEGEFEGWTEPDRDKFVANLLPALAMFDTAGLVVGIHLKALESALENRPDLKEIFGEPYTCCFHWAVQEIANFALKYGHLERIGFIHEWNDFRGQAQGSFDYIRDTRPTLIDKLSLSFGTKSQYVPLQAADVLAYEGNKRIRNIHGKPRRSWLALQPEKYIRLGHYGEHNMAVLIASLTRLRKELLDSGWDGKFSPYVSQNQKRGQRQPS